MPTISDPKKLSAGRTAFTVTFTTEEITPAEEKAIRMVGSQVKIDGFRPGHAPIEVLKEKISPDQIFEETIRLLLPETFQTIVEQYKLEPITHPKVEAESREPITVTVTFIERPPVKVKLGKITIEKKDHKVDDKDIERTVDYILSQHEKTTEVDRATKKGDRVTVDFYGEDKDGKEIDGTRIEGHQVVIGSKTLIPGFEDALVGMKKSEKKSFTVTFPEKYHAEHLQNQPVTFYTTLHKVEEVSKPELTDNFAKTNLGVETAQEFKDTIKNSMIQQEEQIEKQRRENELFNKIREATSVDLADELIAEEEQSIVEDLSKRLADSNLSFDDWLKQTKKSPEEFKKDLRQQASDKITLRLGVQQLIDDKKIDIDDADIETAISEMLAPLSEEQRSHIAPMYAKGNQGWHQLKWQKRVEKLIDDVLA